MANHQHSALSAPRLPVTTAEGLGRANAGIILAAVLAEGSIARAELADQVGLTRATVTRVVSRLIELGLLREESPRRDSPGRPMVPLTLAGENRAVVSVHFGAQEARVGLVDLRGRVLDEIRDLYPSTDPDSIVAMVARHIGTLHNSSARGLTILGVGVSVGGWVSSERGEVVRFDPLGWSQVPLVTLLSRSLRLPISLDQVVRGLSLAERMFGAARGVDDFVEMWIGNVVGVAVVQGGVVHSGTTGATGMISHFPTRNNEGAPCECGRRGCLQKDVSDLSIVDEAHRGGSLRVGQDVRTVVNNAQAGDDVAHRVLSDKGALAGEVAATIADLIDPSAFIVAGVATTADAFFHAFREAFTSHALRSESISVRPSAFGDLAPTIASASVLLHAYYRDPLGFERERDRDEREPR